MLEKTNWVHGGLYRQSREAQTKTHGFSLIELVVVIVIISILMLLAIQRLLSLQVDAERVMMESVAGAVRSAIGIKVAETIVRKGANELATLEYTNPMNLLSEAPANYLGEFVSPDPAGLESGNWYFDTGSRTLEYLVNNTGYFTGGAANPPRARFSVRLVYNDKNGNGIYDAGVDLVEGLRLAVVEPYQWVKQ